MSCCTASTRLVGTIPEIDMVFRKAPDDANPQGALADPTSITVRVLLPDGTVSTTTTPSATITSSSTGLWTYTFPAALTLAGEYWVYVTGAGGGVDVSAQASFTLHDTHVPLP